MGCDNKNDDEDRSKVVVDKGEKIVQSNDSGSYNQDDIAAKEEYSDPAKYFDYDDSWPKEKIVDHLTRQLARSRLPEPDTPDSERRVLFSHWADKGRRVQKYLKMSNVSGDELRQELKKRFGGLEKRHNKYYCQRLDNSKAVFRGMSVKELDNIRKGTWGKETMDKPDRKWADVSTNKSVARIYANEAVLTDGVGVLLEIDTKSIKSRLVSPGYAVDQLDRPVDDINAPDSLFRLPYLEEHHIPPDVDLRTIKMKIKFVGKRSKKMYYKEKYKNINTNWTPE